MEKIKQFKSKKNSVFLVKNNGNFMVLKKFKTLAHYNKEKEFYEILQIENIPLPSVIDINPHEKTILYEYLEAKNGVDLIESFEEANNKEDCVAFLIKIYEWLKAFHLVPYIKDHNLCFYDLNFRNFLLYKNNIYGIDLESIDEGSLTFDMGKMLAMYLNYDEVKSDFKLRVFKSFKEYLIKDNQIASKRLDHIIKKEEKAIKMRRQISY
jgi:tRNA A-37 threonylcarbamoyl transferase component Bud32